MAKVYAALIRKGLKTIEDVPEMLRAEVAALLAEDNDELEAFVPNFGVIDTDCSGQNIIDKGIYNLYKNPKTGELTQKDTDYLLIAKS